MIPSLNGIEISVKGATSVLLGVKGLINPKDLDQITVCTVDKVSATSSAIEKEFPKLFSPGLGRNKDKTFAIEVDSSVAPKFCKARTIPYTLKPKVDKELDRLLQENIITPLSYSRWAAAIVPV